MRTTTSWRKAKTSVVATASILPVAWSRRARWRQAPASRRGRRSPEPPDRRAPSTPGSGAARCRDRRPSAARPRPRRDRRSENLRARGRQRRGRSSGIDKVGGDVAEARIADDVPRGDGRHDEDEQPDGQADNRRADALAAVAPDGDEGGERGDDGKRGKAEADANNAVGGDRLDQPGAVADCGDDENRDRQVGKVGAQPASRERPSRRRALIAPFLGSSLGKSSLPDGPPSMTERPNRVKDACCRVDTDDW